jgi:hypothetical protein
LPRKREVIAGFAASREKDPTPSLWLDLLRGANPLLLDLGSPQKPLFLDLGLPEKSLFPDLPSSRRISARVRTLAVGG